MPIDAAQHISHLSELEIGEFLKSGWFMGWGETHALVAWGPAKKSASAEAEGAWFYVPDFYRTNKKPWLQFAKTAKVEKSVLIEALRAQAALPRLTLSFQEPSRAEFETAFTKIQTEIAGGRLQKAVPVVFATTDTTVTKAMRAYIIRELLQNAKVVTPFGYMTPTEGILGASPEILFELEPESGELTTVALAGTRRSDLEKTESLLQDTKELHEHDLVVQGLKAKLDNLGTTTISQPRVWDIGLISHLRTDVRVRLHDGAKALEKIFAPICDLLHPTAALGLAPVSADWRQLKNFEGPVERARYGAPFGVILPAEKAVALVAIRCLQWRQDGLVSVGSGCGIVNQSEIDKEWQELALKRQSVGALLGL